MKDVITAATGNHVVEGIGEDLVVNVVTNRRHRRNTIDVERLNVIRQCRLGKR